MARLTIKQKKKEKKQLNKKNDILDFSFSDLIDISELQQLINNIAELTNLAIGIADSNNNLLVTAGMKKICSEFHQVHPATIDRCFQNKILIRPNLDNKNPVSFKCKNGLREIAFPIIIENRHVASIFFGQYFYDCDKIDKAFFEQQAKIHGFDKTKYLKSLDEVPIISKEKEETLKKFSANLTQILIKYGYSNLILKKEKIEKLRIANEQLKESELKFRKLFEQVGVGVVKVDISTGKFIKINKKFADMLGYSINELSNLTFREITHPDDFKENLNQADLLLKKQVTEFSTENRYLRKNGTILWAIHTISSISNPSKEENNHIVVIQDITERKKSERALLESELKFRKLFEQAGVGVALIESTAGQFIKINKKYADIYGYTVSEMLELCILDLVHPEEIKDNIIVYDKLLTEKDAEFSLVRRYIHKQGTVGWINITINSVWESEERKYHICIIQDITDSKKTEQALIESECQLKELNTTKDKFFSIIAHDLKNPFTVLKTSSELLARYLEKNDLEKSKAKAEMISNASNHGYALLENLLVWAKSQTGDIKFEPQKLNFNEKVAENIREVENHASQKNIIIINEIPDDLIIEADENILSVVFRNLITNAIKFTHSGGTITITAKAEGELVEVAVIDTGIGIPKEYQYKLFRIDTNFSRVGTANEASTSFGLILCKEFIEKHKGKIWVESEANKGSEFRFTLPYSIRT